MVKIVFNVCITQNVVQEIPALGHAEVQAEALAITWKAEHVLDVLQILTAVVVIPKIPTHPIG